MRKNLGLIIAITCIALVSGIYYAYASKESLLTATIITQAGAEHQFTLEIAQTPKEQQTGLMHRKQMEEGTGMLFIFPTEELQAFWMKNTHIPLDLYYIDKTGRIDQIYKMTKPLSKKTLPSRNPALAVLEINGGLSDKLNIKEGDIIKHPFFKAKDTQ